MPRSAFVVTVFVLSLAGAVHAGDPPESVQAGAALFEAGDLDDAARSFEAVGGADRPWADYYLGRIHFARRDWDGAIERLAAAVEAEPGSALFHRWLGHAHVEKIDTVNAFKKLSVAKSARTHFEQAVALAPSDLDARDALVGYFTNAPAIAGGSREKAEEQIAEFMKISPSQGHVLVGRLHFNEGEWKEAEAAYASAIEADPEVASYHYQLGFARQQQEDYDGAVAAFEQAVALDPESTAALYQIGRTSALSGRNLERGAEALTTYLAQPAERGEPAHEHAHWRLGMVYEHRGEKDRAAASYRAALELDPEHEQAKKALADLD